MSFLDQSKWRQWAQEWGFVHAPQKAWTYPSEWMAGRYRNRLVRIGWGGDRGQRLFIMIRYPSGVDAGGLWNRLEQEERLAAIPGWKKLKPRILPAPIAISAEARQAVVVPPALESATGALKPAGLDVTDQLLLWTRDFAFRRPSPGQVREWVERLVEAVERWTPAFGERCEECRSSRVDGFVMLDGMPALMCAGCQENRKLEGQLEEQRYEQESANHLTGLAYGAAAAALGGGLWALIAIGTGRMFAVAAVGIGVLVAWCWRLGARKVDRAGQIGAAVLTIAGVLFGEVIYYAYGVSQFRPDIGFRIDVGFWVMVEVMQEAPGDVLFSLLCGVFGAWGAVRMLRKPKFVPRIETPQEAVETKKKAA